MSDPMFFMSGDIGEDSLTLEMGDDALCVMVVARTQGKKAPFALNPEVARGFAQNLWRGAAKVEARVAHELQTDGGKTESAHTLLHRLWTRSVGEPGYQKDDWKKLERALLSRGISATDLVVHECPPEDAPLCWGCLILRLDQAAAVMREAGSIPEARENFEAAAAEARSVLAALDQFEREQKLN